MVFDTDVFEYQNVEFTYYDDDLGNKASDWEANSGLILQQTNLCSELSAQQYTQLTMQNVSHWLSYFKSKRYC